MKHSSAVQRGPTTDSTNDINAFINTHRPIKTAMFRVCKLAVSIPFVENRMTDPDLLKTKTIFHMIHMLCANE